MAYVFGQALRSKLESNLSRFERCPLDGSELRRAAVAVVLVRCEDDDSGSVLLTRRASDLRRHGGQFALPGGSLDAGETAEDAALRELEEELGLALGPESVLGMLDDFATRSGFCITPIVAWGGDEIELRPDPREVQRVLRIPLQELSHTEIPPLDPVPGQEQPVLALPLPTLGHNLYAPTAAVLYQFREVALLGKATRVAHFDQPKFAWK